MRPFPTSTSAARLVEASSTRTRVAANRDAVFIRVVVFMVWNRHRTRLLSRRRYDFPPPNGKSPDFVQRHFEFRRNRQPNCIGVHRHARRKPASIGLLKEAGRRAKSRWLAIVRSAQFLPRSVPRIVGMILMALNIDVKLRASGIIACKARLLPLFQAWANYRRAVRPPHDLPRIS